MARAIGVDAGVGSRPRRRAALAADEDAVQQVDSAPNSDIHSPA
jgi:hypothetical protein